MARRYTVFKGSKHMGSSDRWFILKVGGDVPHYRLMLTWYEDKKMLRDSYWRLYTIERMEETEVYYKFYTLNGKLYNCVKGEEYGTTGPGEVYLRNLSLEQPDVPFDTMPPDTNWSEIDWKIYETEGE